MLILAGFILASKKEFSSELEILKTSYPNNIYIYGVKEFFKIKKKSINQFKLANKLTGILLPPCGDWDALSRVSLETRIKCKTIFSSSHFARVFLITSLVSKYKQCTGAILMNAEGYQSTPWSAHRRKCIKVHPGAGGCTVPDPLYLLLNYGLGLHSE